jgi:hypothetical protein
MDAKTPNKIPIGQRPTYFDSQLLLKDDFLDEQNYHVAARKRHNLSLYDWGVVSGLKIARERDTLVRISAGAAIDESGQEIFLDESTTVDLGEFGANDRINIGLAYEEAPATNGTEEKRINCYAVVTVAKDGQTSKGLTLAIVALDGQGKVDGNAIDYSKTRYARPKPGSIAAAQLHDDLRKGWLRLPFRPDQMVEGPEEGTEAGLPAFRIGATEALSPDPKEAGEKDRGAAGTMAIPIPPSVKQVTRFRIAGMENKGEISILLIKAGWDPLNMKHVRTVLIEEKITRKEPFLEIYKINEKETTLDPEYHTLSLWLKGTRRTAISLVAVEFAY